VFKKSAACGRFKSGSGFKGAAVGAWFSIVLPFNKAQRQSKGLKVCG
jgi:hypothetical protein